MFEQDFEQLLRQYETALDDKKKFTALVKDLFPDQAKTVNGDCSGHSRGCKNQ